MARSFRGDPLRQTIDAPDVGLRLVTYKNFPYFILVKSPALLAKRARHLRKPVKTIHLLLRAALSLSVPASAWANEPGKSSGLEVFEKGRAAYYRGDLVTARRCFEQLLKVKPDFELARIHLAQVTAGERELAKIPKSLKLARAGLIERIEWDGGNVSDAIATVAKELERQGGGPDHWRVSVGGHLPAQVRNRNISLSASKVSPDNIFEAAGFAGGVQVSYTAEGIALRELGEGRQTWDAGDPKAPGMETAAKKLNIDRFVMEEATVADAMSFLQRKAAALSGGNVRPIFVIRYDTVPRGDVSLDLRNVSLHDAVRSVCLVADLEEKWFPWGAGIGNRQAAAAATSPPVKDETVK